MSARDLVREAMRALEANRGRSLLTILGIVIGIAAVISMTSLIGGVRNMLVEGLGLNAARAVYISPYQQMTTNELADLERLMPEFEMVAGSAYGFTQMQHDDRTVDVSITGGDADYLSITGRVHLVEGRTFTAAEEAGAERVCIIDRAGAQVLFGNADMSVTGKTVRLASHDYRVVGLADGQPLANTDKLYITVYMPLETVLADFSGGYPYLSEVIGLAREDQDIDAVIEATKQQMARIQGFPEDEADDNLYVYSMKSQIDSMTGFMNSFSLIMGAVAGISLIVGGIGIMNMMLTNVTERIREIGLRRALGATRRDITMQFLVESATICVAGGIIGTLLGYAASWGLSFAASALGIVDTLGGMGSTVSIAPAVSLGAIAAATGLSVLIGVVFGFYPARRAARLDPVECLRSQ